MGLGGEVRECGVIGIAKEPQSAGRQDDFTAVGGLGEHGRPEFVLELADDAVRELAGFGDKEDPAACFQMSLGVAVVELPGDHDILRRSGIDLARVDPDRVAVAVGGAHDFEREGGFLGGLQLCGGQLEFKLANVGDIAGGDGGYGKIACGQGVPRGIR